MQSVSTRIWTRVAVSISYHDNHYTMGTFNKDLLTTIWVSWKHFVIDYYFELVKLLFKGIKVVEEDN